MEGEDRSKLVLDVASVIMNEFMDRSRKINLPTQEPDKKALENLSVQLSNIQEHLNSISKEQTVLSSLIPNHSSKTVNLDVHSILNKAEAMAQTVSELSSLLPSLMLTMEFSEITELKEIVSLLIQHSSKERSEFSEQISLLTVNLSDLQAKYQSQIHTLSSEIESIKLQQMPDISQFKSEIYALVNELEQTLSIKDEKIGMLLEELRVKSEELTSLKETTLNQEEKIAEDSKTVEEFREALAVQQLEFNQKMTGVFDEKRLLREENERLKFELAMIQKQQLEEKENLSVTGSTSGKRSRTGSISGTESIRALPSSVVRVVFTGFRDSTGPKSLKYLGGLVESLGGLVHISERFHEHITHVVAPSGCQSIKVLAASLTAKWIMPAEWLIRSAEAGHFLPETEVEGAKRYVEERPFRSKTFHLNVSFCAQQIRHQFDQSCCRTLIETLGKGHIAKELDDKVDYILVADSDSVPETDDQVPPKRLTLKSFLAMIPGYNNTL